LKETSIWDYGITSDNLNDNRFIIRLNSLIRFISFGNYWVHVLFFCFLSFSGIILLYRVFSTFVSRKKILFYALLGVPTISFWGSGITKETIFILGAGVF